LVALVAVLAMATGCSAPAPTASPEPTAESGPRTLVDLIGASPEHPELVVDETTRAGGDGSSTVVARYDSEGLVITGLLTVPDGDGPFPGVVVVHGSVDPGTFTTGSDLMREQQALARSGHIVFAPDLRGLGGSDADPAGGTDIYIGSIADILNAGRALTASDLPQLDADRVGLFGHSLGGGESMGAMVVAPELFDVVVAMSPVSTRTWWVIDHYIPRDSQEFAAITAVHGTYEEDPKHWDDASPATFADRAQAPLLIAYGTADDPVYATWEEHTVADWQAAGAPVELLTVEGGNRLLDPHWDASWRRIEGFLDETLLS
jgi:dipeptidyl aminopeptidase/acylaminoacyl peptidase